MKNASLAAVIFVIVVIGIIALTHCSHQSKQHRIVPVPKVEYSPPPPERTSTPVPIKRVPIVVMPVKPLASPTPH